jgi:cell division septum initiation protein DivIVA
MDRSQEREVQRLLQDQARHVARLLDLKRQSLANYTRDQLDLVAEKSRIERETQRLRRQNDRHSLREMQRQVNESVEKQKQRKLDQIRHSEEKYSFRISQLKRPVGAQRGINDLAYWRSGRE